MIATSDYYKAHIDDKTIPWTFKVVIDYSDYNIDNTIAVSVDKPSRQSIDAQIADGIKTPTYAYWSWNDFEWGQHLQGENELFNEHGAISEQLSNQSGVFSEGVGQWIGYGWIGHDFIMAQARKPSFTVNFTERTISSLEVVFDEKVVQYAPDFDVEIYQTGVLHSTETVTGNGGTLWNKTLATAIDDVTELRLIIGSWNIQGANARVLEFYTSIQETYFDDDIISFSTLEESEPEKATTPIGNVTANSCDLSLVNINNKFDNDNEDSSLQNSLTKNRRISLFSGIRGDLDDVGNQNYIPLGQFYSQDWITNNDELSVSVSGLDLVQALSDSEYTQSQFINPGVDQAFTYTTTAEFDAFSRSNTEGFDDKLILSGEAIVDSALGSMWVDYGWIGHTFMGGFDYTGTADKIVTYTYTPGTSVKIALSKTDDNAGGKISYLISTDSGVSFTEVNGDFSYVPATQSTVQTFVLRVVMLSPSQDSSMSVSDISLAVSSKVSLLSLADKVLNDFNTNTKILSGGWQIDSALGEIEIPNAYIPKSTYREALILICEAGAARGYTDRLGVFRIVQVGDIPTNDTMRDISAYFSLQNPNNAQGVINRVSVTTQPLVQATVAEDVLSVKETIDANETVTYIVNFKEDPVDTVNTAGSVFPAGVSITDETIYTWGASITVENTNGSAEDIELKATGKPYRIEGEAVTQLDNSTSIRANGVTELRILNSLLQTTEQAEDIAGLLISTFANFKREAESDILPDPSIEVGDGLTLTSLYNVYQNSIEYGDGFTQIIKGVKV